MYTPSIHAPPSIYLAGTASGISTDSGYAFSQYSPSLKDDTSDKVPASLVLGYGSCDFIIEPSLNLLICPVPQAIVQMPFYMFPVDQPSLTGGSKVGCNFSTYVISIENIKPCAQELLGISSPSAFLGYCSLCLSSSSCVPLAHSCVSSYSLRS